jgi:Lar family restriction alleviation protein
MDEERKLLPCPFCGSERIRHCDTTPAGQHWFACDECSCEGPPSDIKAAALTAWNTRSNTRSGGTSDE